MLRDSIETLKLRPQLYRAKLGVYLFIASLAVFFLASLIAYAVVRTSVSIDLAPLEIPKSFIASTFILILISVGLQLSVSAIRKEQLQLFRRYLNAAILLAVIFFLLQIAGLSNLIKTHFSSASGHGKLYGISFTLALIHALHVLGGVVFLAYVWQQTLQGRYDHERHWTVDICTTYWHFLDAVWIVMLLTFWLIELRVRS